MRRGLASMFLAGTLLASPSRGCDLVTRIATAPSVDGQPWSRELGRGVKTKMYALKVGVAPLDLGARYEHLIAFPELGALAGAQLTFDGWDVEADIWVDQDADGVADRGYHLSMNIFEGGFFDKIWLPRVVGEAVGESRDGKPAFPGVYKRLDENPHIREASLPAEGYANILYRANMRLCPEESMRSAQGTERLPDRP